MTSPVKHTQLPSIHKLKFNYTYHIASTILQIYPPDSLEEYIAYGQSLDRQEALGGEVTLIYKRAALTKEGQSR